MAARLPIDANVIGYFGFDEANDTDPAIDESTSASNLTWSGSPSAQSSRVGNAKLFDGSTVFASPSSSTLYQLGGSISLICWVSINSLNGGGSLLRTIVACDGTTTGSGDNTQFNLSISSTGAVVLKHEHGSAVAVLFTSAGDTVQIGKFFSIAVVRTVAAGVATAVLYVNNVLVPWATITDGGTPTSSPTAPSGGSTATFRVGKSGKASDSAFWSGLIDELSVHNVARTPQPYLTAAYYRIALSIMSARFTAYGTVKSIGSADMGGGNRWWVYERDLNLYVVRENSLGFYSSEVQLTTSGSTYLSAPIPASASQPEVLYDAASDTLLVAFLSGNKIFKLTATSEDAPSTQNMPYTADTSGQVKVDSITEAWHSGAGGGLPSMVYGAIGDGGQMSEINPVAPVLSFLSYPSFAVAINNANPYGYALYQVLGGAATLVAMLTTPSTLVGSIPNSVYLYPISSRIYGAQYYARPIRKNGTIGTNYSGVIQDWLGQMVPLTVDSAATAQMIDSSGGDLTDHGNVGAGEADNYPSQSLVTYVNRQPLKLQYSDPDGSTNTVGAGEADNYPSQFLVVYVNRQPIKLSYQDTDGATNTVGAGTSSDHLQIGSAGRSIQIIQ